MSPQVRSEVPTSELGLDGMKWSLNACWDSLALLARQLTGDGEAGMTLAEGLTPQILSDLGIDPGHV